MKNFFLGILFLIFFVTFSFCLTEVHEVAYSTATYGGVGVSTSAATQVDDSVQGNTLGGRFVVRVFNDNTTREVFCGFDSNVSTVTTSPRFGERIAPRTGTTFHLASSIQLFCRADSAASSTTTVVVQQLR